MSFEFSYFGPELPVVGLLFALMLLVSEIGYRIGRSGTVRAAGMGTHVTPLVTGTLALVALLLGFSLSMAVSRFDVRGQLLQAEATAIGTAHLRARLLPAPEGPVLEDRLRRYVDLSLETAGRAPDRSRTTETVRAAEALQTEMLATAVTLARQAATRAPADRFAEAMKDVVDVHERRLSAFETSCPRPCSTSWGSPRWGRPAGRLRLRPPRPAQPARDLGAHGARLRGDPGDRRPRPPPPRDDPREPAEPGAAADAARGGTGSRAAGRSVRSRARGAIPV
jgi:hypothetical protein